MITTYPPKRIRILKSILYVRKGQIYTLFGDTYWLDGMHMGRFPAEELKHIEFETVTEEV